MKIQINNKEQNHSISFYEMLTNVGIYKIYQPTSDVFSKRRFIVFKQEGSEINCCLSIIDNDSCILSNDNIAFLKIRFVLCDNPIIFSNN